MAKQARDWKAAFDAFTKENNKSGISQKKWCENNDISYNTSRREFKKIRDKAVSDAITSDDPLSDSDQNSESPASSRAKPASNRSKEVKNKKRNPNMARPGNQNARVHGLFSKRFGEAWDLAQCFDQDIRYQVLQAQGIQVEMFATEYQEVIDDIKAKQAEENRPPTDEEFERLSSLSEKLERCTTAQRYIIDLLDRLDSNVESRIYTQASTKKLLADIKLKAANTRKATAEAISLERENSTDNVEAKEHHRRLQNKMLEHSIDKTAVQEKLAKAQLDALTRDSDDDMDELDELFDEIMSERDPLFKDIPEEY